MNGGARAGQTELVTEWYAIGDEWETLGDELACGTTQPASRTRQYLRTFPRRLEKAGDTAFVRLSSNVAKAVTALFSTFASSNAASKGRASSLKTKFKGSNPPRARHTEVVPLPEFTIRENSTTKKFDHDVHRGLKAQPEAHLPLRNAV